MLRLKCAVHLRFEVNDHIICDFKKLSPLIKVILHFFLMNNRWQSKKERNLTKDRFQSIIHHKKSKEEIKQMPWYFQRGNFFTLLMIVVIFMLSLAVKAIYEVKAAFDLHSDSKLENNISEDEPSPMDYEEAKRIFQGESQSYDDS